VDLRQLARPALERLQDAFGDTAVLTETSRGEAVCSEVITGTYPVHANYVTVGTRRPLGVGAGSLAVLAWLPPAERARRLQQTARKLTNYLQLDAASIAAEADAACARGYVLFLDWVVEGMGGIAVPILDYDGWPIGALSVAALSTRIRSREVAMARLLRQEARRITSAWTRAVVPAGALSVPAREAGGQRIRNLHFEAEHRTGQSLAVVVDCQAAGHPTTERALSHEVEDLQAIHVKPCDRPRDQRAVVRLERVGRQLLLDMRIELRRVGNDGRVRGIALVAGAAVGDAAQRNAHDDVSRSGWQGQTNWTRDWISARGTRADHTPIISRVRS
jgi:hypothetical protein